MNKINYLLQLLDDYTEKDISDIINEYKIDTIDDLIPALVDEITIWGNKK